MEDQDDEVRKSAAGNPAAELEVMQQVLNQLQKLPTDAQSRVVAWVSSVLELGGQKAKAPSRIPAPDNSPSLSGMTVAHSESDWTDIADLFFAAGPSTDAEKALVAAYWHQEVEGDPDVDTQTVNTDLKHMGYGIGNITRAFERLKKQRPALVIQTRKSGSTRQARKRFKVTAEGRNEVQRMLNRPVDG